MPLPPALAVFAAYLLGALPFGYWLVRLRKGEDVRAVGSGATGATNVARAAGLAGGVVTLLLDAGKGYGAVWLAGWLTQADALWVAAAGFAAVFGHCFPVFLGFRGGKGVATAIGVFAFAAPLAVAAMLAVWLIVFLLWRYVSLGSILSVAVYPALAHALAEPRPALAASVAAVAVAVLIILRHASNIERLVAGTESKFSLRPKA